MEHHKKVSKKKTLAKKKSGLRKKLCECDDYKFPVLEKKFIEVDPTQTHKRFIHHVLRLHLATAPPATTSRPNWEAEIYDDALISHSTNPQYATDSDDVTD